MIGLLRWVGPPVVMGFLWVANSPVRWLVLVFAVGFAVIEIIHGLVSKPGLTVDEVRARYFANREFAAKHNIEHWSGRATARDRRRYARGKR